MSSVTQYKTQLRKHLTCSGPARKRLLGQFDASLSCLLEENPNPDLEALNWAFGSPDKMAHTLMENVTPEEQRRYRTSQLLRRFLAGILLCVFLLFTAYVFLEKQKPLYTADEVVPATVHYEDSIEPGGD